MRAGLVKKSALAFQPCSVSPPSAQIMRGFLSSIHHENLVKLLGVKAIKVCVPLEFLTLRLVYIESPAICQLQSRFSYLGTISPGGFCLWVFAPVSHDSLYSPVVSLILGAVVFPVSSSLMDPRRIVDFSVCFSVFLFVVMMEYWLPSSLGTKPETRSRIF